MELTTTQLVNFSDLSDSDTAKNKKKKGLELRALAHEDNKKLLCTSTPVSSEFGGGKDKKGENPSQLTCEV